MPLLMFAVNRVIQPGSNGQHWATFALGAVQLHICNSYLLLSFWSVKKDDEEVGLFHITGIKHEPKNPTNLMYMKAVELKKQGKLLPAN
jgi:hypothetical protein